MVEKPNMEKRSSGAEASPPKEALDGSGDSEEGSSSESEADQARSSSQKKETLISTKPHRQLCRSPCLDRPSFSQSSILQDLCGDDSRLNTSKPSTDKGYQAKMDFALKLGYSGEQVEAVLSKLGASALINDILAELVRLGNKGDMETQASCCTNTGSSSNAGALAPRNTCPKEITSPEVSLEDDSVDNVDNLRPIVIDGSNVAMR